MSLLREADDLTQACHHSCFYCLQYYPDDDDDDEVVDSDITTYPIDTSTVIHPQYAHAQVCSNFQLTARTHSQSSESDMIHQALAHTFSSNITRSCMNF